jgi:glycosyltransferase involved in cell wall biosynthesis
MSNLAVLAPEYGGSGAAGEPVQHTLLAKALARRNYTVSMITADYGQPDGAIWHGVKTFKAFDRGAGLPLLRFVHPRWTGLWSALKRADADVYYVSCAGGIVGQIAMFCRRHRKRLIFRVASDSDCTPDTLLIPQCYWRDSRLYEYGLRRASAVLAQSVRQQQLLERNYGVSSSIAGLLVEPANAHADFGGRDIDALWVSNIRSVKRADVLLDVAERLPDISFQMVGGTVPGELQRFEAIRARARSTANVTFHGAVPYREAYALYARARVFVNTSDVEGFPNTYLQAWASGTPVVAFFDPDNLIAREGLGAAVRTQQEMATAIRTLVHDESAWNAARARCLAYIEREYNEATVLEPYLQLIDMRHGR